MSPASKFIIVYDRIAKTPGHDQYVVDVINEPDKASLDILVNCLVSNLKELTVGVKRTVTYMIKIRMVF